MGMRQISDLEKWSPMRDDKRTKQKRRSSTRKGMRRAWRQARRAVQRHVGTKQMKNGTVGQRWKAIVRGHKKDTGRAR
jgi:hypothetical protein